jgi:hypothetical protein
MVKKEIAAAIVAPTDDANESPEEDFAAIRKDAKKHKNKKVKNLGEVMSSLLAETDSTKVNIIINHNLESHSSQE